MRQNSFPYYYITLKKENELQYKDKCNTPIILKYYERSSLSSYKSYKIIFCS